MVQATLVASFERERERERERTSREKEWEKKRQSEKGRENKVIKNYTGLL